MKPHLNLILLFIGVAAFGWVLGRYTASLGKSAKETSFSMEMIPDPSLDRLGKESQDRISEVREQSRLLLMNARSTDPLLRARTIAELGKYYFAYGFFDAAEACFQIAQRWQPTEYRWSYLLGQTYRQKGQLDQAAESLERSLAIARLDMSFPTSQGVALLTWLGEIYQGSSKIDRAEACLREALQEDPQSASTLMQLGQLAAARGDHKQAIGHFERVVELHPHARSVVLLLAGE